MFACKDDKRTFYRCRRIPNSNPKKFELPQEDCAKGREFDPKSGYCKLEGGAQISSENNGSEPFECRKRGRHIDLKSDTHFYECTVIDVAKGVLKAIRYNCPPNEVFSGVEFKCIQLP